MTATAAPMAPTPPAPASKNHRSPVPPTNISTAPMPRMRTVPDRCGSSGIRAATTPQHQRKGQDTHAEILHPVVVQCDDVGKHQHHRKLCDLAGLQGAEPRMTSHRLRPLYSGMKSTAASNISDSPSSGHASLWKIW